MDITEDTLKKVSRYASLKYSIDHICTLLGLSGDKRAEFIKWFEDPEDPIRLAYDQGLARGDYKIDKKLAIMAKGGDVEAIAELRTRQYHRKNEELKKELFGL